MGGFQARNHNVKVYIIFAGNGGFRNHNVKVYIIFAGNGGVSEITMLRCTLSGGWGLGGGGLSKGCF